MPPQPLPPDCCTLALTIGKPGKGSPGSHHSTLLLLCRFLGFGHRLRCTKVTSKDQQGRWGPLP